MMKEWLRGSSQDESTPIVDLHRVIRALKDESRELEWDEAWDTVDLLDSSYEADVPFLLETAGDQKAESSARKYSINAVLKIGGDLSDVLPILADLLRDRDQYVRGEVITALAKYGHQNLEIAVPALVTQVKDWHSWLGIQGAAFSALVKLLGFGGAMRALRTR